jgi:putative DNA primase/helicase
MALCNLLAFWTKDAGQIDRLFRQSKLYRVKWDERHGKETIGQRTIRKALSGVSETYTGGFGGGRRALTDVGNAERLVLLHGDTLKFCDALGGWHIWDGIRWKQDKEYRALALAKDTVKGIYGEAAEEPEESERKSLAKHAGKSENVQRIRAMLELAKPDLALLPENLDANPMT